MAKVYATLTGHVTVKDYLIEGEEYDTDDEVVRLRPDCFTKPEPEPEPELPKFEPKASSVRLSKGEKIMPAKALKHKSSGQDGDE